MKTILSFQKEEEVMSKKGMNSILKGMVIGGIVGTVVAAADIGINPHKRKGIMKMGKRFARTIGL